MQEYTFSARLTEALQRQRLTLKEASVAIGRGEKYLSNTLRAGSSPSLETVRALAALLHVSPNYLAGMDEQFDVAAEADPRTPLDVAAEKVLSDALTSALRNFQWRGLRPTTDDITDWWLEQNGRLGNFDKIAPHVDLYAEHATDASLPTPHAMGPDSLSSRAFGFSEVTRLAQLFTTLDPGFNEGVLLSHSQALAGEMLYSIEELDIAVPTREERVKIRYKRLLLPVTDAKGRRYTLNYSQPIWKP